MAAFIRRYRWPLINGVLVILAFSLGRLLLSAASAPNEAPAPTPTSTAPTATATVYANTPTLPPTATVQLPTVPPTATPIPPTATPAPTPTPLTIASLPLQAEATRDAPTGGTLRWRVEDEPATLDPALTDDGNSRALVGNLFDGLVQLDPTMAVRPALARSWNVSPDGKTYTFALRSNLSFSNADSLTAADVLYSWNRVASNPTAPSRRLFSIIAGYDDLVAGRTKTLRGLTAPNAQTVRVELTKPAAYWLSQATLPAFAIVDRKPIESYGTRWTDGGLLVGSGAYILESWRHDQNLRLIANPFYWEGRAGVDAVEVAIIKDDTTARARYVADALDEIGLPASQVATVRSDSALRGQLHETPALRLTWLGFKFDGASFGSDVRIRQALWQAIDRRALVTKKLDGYALPVASLLSAFAPDTPDPYPFDPDKARAALRDAGYDTAAKRADLAKRIAYSFNQTDLNTAVATEIQQQLQANLDLSISLDPSPSFAAFLRQRDLDHSFSFFRGVAVPDYPDPHAILSANFATGAPANGGLYSASDFDAAIIRADSDPNPATRTQSYASAARILSQNAVAIPLYADSINRLQKPRVLHWGWTAAGPMPFKYAGVAN